MDEVRKYQGEEEDNIDPNIIRRDLYFLMIDNKENRRFCTINQKNVTINHLSINLTFFENKELNTFWEIEDCKDTNKYFQTTYKNFFNEDIIENESNLDYQNEKITKNSNKEIYSSLEGENAQKLTEDEIMSLKSQGLTGDEIIKTIIKNNTSMDKRTSLSQEKIIKRKDKRHRYKLWLTPISIMNCVETFFIESPIKIKMDSLSTILNYTNLGENAKTIIYEDTSGFLTTALAQRSSVNANIVSLYDGKIRGKNSCLLNLTENDKIVITYLKLDILMNPKTTYHNIFSRFYLNSFDNLLLCLKTEENLVQIFFSLFPYLRLCGMIVIFSTQLQVLIGIEKYLFDNKIAIDIKIHETITREYQILTLRTHPEMNNKGYSGYVLTAIKVDKAEK